MSKMKKRMSLKGGNLLEQNELDNSNDNYEWPGDIDEKLIDEIKNRLNLVENDNIDDHEIRGFLGATKLDIPTAYKNIIKYVEFKRGHQLFYQHYRSNNERYLFLKNCRTEGRSISKDGRIVFYEKIAKNFNLPLFSEFTENEFELHTISWLENIKNDALKNHGVLITKIPLPKNTDYIDDNDDDDDKNNDKDDDEESLSDLDNNKDDSNKEPIPDESKNDNLGNCPHKDIIGIIDWDGLDSEKFLKNEGLLKIADEIITSKYPYLFYKLIHINMPLSFKEMFEKITSTKIISELTLNKSIFLDSNKMKELKKEYEKELNNKNKNKRREAYKSSRSKQKSMSKKTKNEIEKEKELKKKEIERINYCIKGHLEDEVTDILLKEIDEDQLPKDYGGTNVKCWSKADPFFCSLIGGSADSSQYDENENEDDGQWKEQSIRKRQTERINEKVYQGEHWFWEFTMEKILDRGKGVFPFIKFGMELEIAGYRNKPIMILIREEKEYQSSYHSMYGDFVILQDGKLRITLKNEQHNIVEVKIKLTKKKFKDSFIAKYLPNYEMEYKQSELQNTNNRGNKHFIGGTPNQRRGNNMLRVDNNKDKSRAKSVDPPETPSSPKKGTSSVKRNKKNKKRKR